MFSHLKVIFLFASFGVALSTSEVNGTGGGYGIDCSWPIHSKEDKCNGLLGDRKTVYEEYLDGCRKQWGTKGAKRCDANEEDRLDMTIRQAQSMVVSKTKIFVTYP